MKNLSNTRKPNPVVNANIFSKSIFWWLKDFIVYASKCDLKSNDLYGILEEDKTEPLGDDLEKAWFEECEHARERKKEPNLSKCALKLYGKEYFKYAMIYIFMAFFQLMQPLTIKMVMSYFDTPPKASSLQAYSYATACVLLVTLTAIFRRYGYFKLTCLGMHVKIACSSLIYRKVLRLPSSLKSSGASESMINLLSNDVARFEYMCYYSPFLFIIPIQTIFMLYLISRYLSITMACVTIILLMLQSLPIQAMFYKISSNLRVIQTAETDKRISLISEILNAIRMIKMYAWEQYFESLVYLRRRNEIKKFLTMSYASSVAYSTAHFVHRWCIFSVILVCMFHNKILLPTQIVPVIQCLSSLRESITFFLPDTIKNLTSAAVSIKRIEAFLVQEEVESKVKTILNGDSDKNVEIKAVSAFWDDENYNEVIKDVNLEVERGKLFVVIGPIGCGKSTLLKLILGEIPPKTGDIYIRGKVSYASQEPWLFNGSIKDNILFGNEYDELKYKQVIKSCALLDDFTQLPYGDKTLVGEKGMSLSGGQCTRVNLARAVYRNADIYLLDDPLSSVDSRVARKLFEDCIDNLLKDKTRILVTHNRMYLDRAHSIIVMSDGTIQYKGSITELESCGLNLRNLTLDEGEKPRKKIDSTAVIEHSTDAKKIFTDSDENTEEQPNETEEFLTQGSIPKLLILKYIKASKSFFLFSFWILSTISVILLCALFEYLIVSWTDKQKTLVEIAGQLESYTNNHTNVNIQPLAATDIKSFLALFGSLMLLVTVTSILNSLAYFKFMFNANQNIHNSMFTTLIKTPLKFFETNPSGRIMNRFTEDVSVLDDRLTPHFNMGVESSIEALAFLLCVLIINWWYSTFIVIIGFFVFKIYNLYAPTLRGVMRLDTIAKSPVLSFAITSSMGKDIIRAFDAKKNVDKIFNSHLDEHTSAHFVYLACSNAFAAWLDLFSAVLFFFIVYTSLIFKSTGTPAGYIGLMLVQIANVSVFITSTVRLLFFTTYECLVNVERMFQVTKLEPEEDLDNLTTKVSKSWPTDGKIEFVDLYLKYSDGDQPILKNLNITIESQSKVGVVGRTGAGKSSLISALFRLAKIDGTIMIDGIDIKQISLKDLRSKISIIPQEPILFSGTLRSNLDPFNEADDATLWAAIDSVELKKVFVSLDHAIEKGGCNLSLGQRQLVCLARAIFRNNKILVLDEATASVDSETDVLIQKTLRAKFNSCTVITIAHRLNTVMDSDKILVMDNGKVVEYDHPDALLKDINGCFYKMAQQSNIPAGPAKKNENMPSAKR